MVRPARCIGVSSVANQTRHRACTSGSRRSLVIARQIIVFWPAEPARSADHRAHGSLCRAFAGSVQELPAMIARGSTRLFERASNLCANGTRDERFALRESRACRLANGKRGEGARSSRSQTSASISGAILVNILTLERWQLLLMKAVAISSTTGIYALLFGCVSGREVTRDGIGVARIDRSNTR